MPPGTPADAGTVPPVATCLQLRHKNADGLTSDMPQAIRIVQIAAFDKTGIRARGETGAASDVLTAIGRYEDAVKFRQELVRSECSASRRRSIQAGLHVTLLATEGSVR
jgi:hypothetical protein